MTDQPEQVEGHDILDESGRTAKRIPRPERVEGDRLVRGRVPTTRPEQVERWTILMCHKCKGEAVYARDASGYECPACGTDEHLQYIEVVPATRIAELEGALADYKSANDTCETRWKVDQTRITELEGAAAEALYALIGGDGPPDTTKAQMWLRTTLPKDHPNYVDHAVLVRRWLS